MQFQDVIEQRFSVREFDVARPVERELIDQVLEAGRIAPTARNCQPQRFFVLTKPEDLAKMDQCTPCRYGAPVVIIASYSNEAAAVHKGTYRGDWTYGEMDSVSCLVHMMLKATDLGLGTCWVGRIDEAKIHELFDIPRDNVIYSVLPLGYPACGPGPRHTQRLPLSDTVTWL